MVGWMMNELGSIEPMETAISNQERFNERAQSVLP
jgi:hypothetical protein